MVTGLMSEPWSRIGVCGMGNQTLSTGSKKVLSGAGDWVAPVLAWTMFIGMLSAIVSVLLGPAK
jgi:hypothetical protein